MAQFKYNINNGRYSPYTGGIDPVWDNSNHLMEEMRRRQEEAEAAAVFDFNDLPDDDCPF